MQIQSGFRVATALPRPTDIGSLGRVASGPRYCTGDIIAVIATDDACRAAGDCRWALFLPSFLFVAVSGPFITRLRRSAIAGAFLDGVNVASLALMAAVSLQLARASLVDLPTALIALASLVLLVRFRVSSTRLVLGVAIMALFLTARR